jgi:hypothetical protein
MGLLRELEPETGSQPQVDCVRAAMLGCLADALPDQTNRPPVWAKINGAGDMQTLWYLRSDVMHLLSDHCGESVAASRLDSLTELFRGHLPAAQFSSARRRS